jgi:hypothetical protein
MTKRLTNADNVCAACGENFGSVDLFDRHRVGTHDYTLTEGLRMEPPREDGRRCLSADEMRERGWDLGLRGRWLDPAKRHTLARPTPNTPLSAGS